MAALKTMVNRDGLARSLEMGPPHLGVHQIALVHRLDGEIRRALEPLRGQVLGRNARRIDGGAAHRAEVVATRLRARQKQVEHRNMTYSKIYAGFQQENPLPDVENILSRSVWPKMEVMVIHMNCYQSAQTKEGSEDVLKRTSWTPGYT